jgi:hypothetical protein
MEKRGEVGPSSSLPMGTRHSDLKKSFKLAVRSLLTACSNHVIPISNSILLASKKSYFFHENERSVWFFFWNWVGILQSVSKFYECWATTSPPPIYSGLILFALKHIRAYSSGWKTNYALFAVLCQIFFQVITSLHENIEVTHPSFTIIIPISFLINMLDRNTIQHCNCLF